MRREPFLKIRKIFLFERRPDDFREREHSRENHIFDLVGRRNIFRPEVRLRAEDVFFLVFDQFFRLRVVIVNLFERQVIADVERLGARVAGGAGRPGRRR